MMVLGYLHGWLTGSDYPSSLYFSLLVFSSPSLCRSVFSFFLHMSVNVSFFLSLFLSFVLFLSLSLWIWLYKASAVACLAALFAISVTDCLPCLLTCAELTGTVGPSCAKS